MPDVLVLSFVRQGVADKTVEVLKSQAIIFHGDCKEGACLMGGPISKRVGNASAAGENFSEGRVSSTPFHQNIYIY